MVDVDVCVVVVAAVIALLLLLLFLLFVVVVVVYDRSMWFEMYELEHDRKTSYCPRTTGNNT